MLHRIISRGLIRDVLIGIAVAVVAGSIGYKINDYLSRDKISIERVDLAADTTKLPYPLKEMMDLYQNPRFKDYYLSRGSLVTRFIPRFYNRTSRPLLQKEDVDEIITLLEDFSQFDEELQARERAVLQQLESYKLGDNLIGILPRLRYFSYRPAMFVGSTDVEKIQNTINILKNEKTDIEAVHQSKEALLGILKSFKPKRTGTVIIKLILLNSGDTDGLVKQDGELQVGNLSDPIYIIEKNTYDDPYDLRYSYIRDFFQSVPKRSLVQRFFTVNESKTAPGVLNEFKSMVKRGYPARLTITLFDIRDDPIGSRESQLPVIQE